MTKLAMGIPIAAAVVLSGATPIRAQQVIYEPGYCAQFYPSANCQNMGPNNPYTGDYQRRQAYDRPYSAHVRRHSATASRGLVAR
jgi:hypothetical protein